MKDETDGCGTAIGAFLALVAIYVVGGLLLRYVLGGFGVHISYPLAVATFFLIKVLTPSRG